MDNIQALVESAKYPRLTSSDAEAMRVLLNNTQAEHQRIMTESTVAGDVGQFTPILMPLVREAFPKLVANELLGVQPMTTPTGYMYALVNRLQGTGNTADKSKVQAIKFKDTLLPLADQSTAAGVLAIEGKWALVEDGTQSYTLEDANGTAVADGVYSNQTLLDRLFSTYTGTYTTAQSEALGKDMREIGFTVERKSIEAKARALKARYTVEMFQDLKSQHGLAADEELISLISNEVRAEIDRDVINFVNANATIAADSSVFSGTADESGRWEIEKFRSQATRIAKEAALIGIQSRRAQGNVLLVSPLVATMLQQAGTFKTAQVDSAIDPSAIGGAIGTFDNRFKVVVDQFAANDYCTVLYKGADRRDAMGVFAPYVPLSFTRVTDYESGQPAVIAKTRYALDTIPDVHARDEDLKDPTRGSRYARTFSVDFKNTSLA